MELTTHQQSILDKAVEYALSADTSQPYFIINGKAKSGKTFLFNELACTLLKTTKLLNTLNEHTNYTIELFSPQISFVKSSYHPELHNHFSSRPLHTAIGYTNKYHTAYPDRVSIFMMDNADTIDISSMTSTNSSIRVILFTSNQYNAPNQLTDCFSPFKKLLTKALDKPPIHPNITYLSPKIFEEKAKQAILTDPINTVHVCECLSQKLDVNHIQPKQGMLYYRDDGNSTYYHVVDGVKEGYSKVPLYAGSKVIQTRSVPKALPSTWINQANKSTVNTGIYFDMTPCLSVLPEQLYGTSYETLYVDLPTTQLIKQLPVILGTATKHIYIKGGS